MRSLLTALIVLACPLMMLLMMRGMHSGRTNSETENHTQRRSPYDVDPRDARPAELEREVTELRAARNRDEAQRR